MTTITFEEEIEIKKNKFLNINDFLEFLAKDERNLVEFWVLENPSDDIRNLVTKSKKWEINFVNI